MRLFASALILAYLYHHTIAEEVRLIDLEPKDAQQIIESKDTALHYAPKIDSNVPAVRYLGNEPHNVAEDIYLANQYHGQDGLGGYLYGYSVPDIAKTEKKKAGGDLRGAYNYIAGNGQEIKVEYWDDGNGFHQVDNVPKILPKQIDDTPEVAAAKAEHQRIWQEQAIRNSKPIANPYDNSNQASQVQQLVNQYQQQKQQYPNPGQNIYYRGAHEGQYPSQQPQQAQYQPQPAGVVVSPAGAFQKTNSFLGAASGSQSTGFYGGQYQGQAAQNVPQYQQPQQHAQQTQQTQAAQNVPQYQETHQPVLQTQYSQSADALGSGRQAPGPAQPNTLTGQFSGFQSNEQGRQFSASEQRSQYASGQYGSSSSGKEQDDGGNWKYVPTEEEQGPPKGFFYNFDYPVGIIVQKDGQAVNDIYAANRANFEKQLHQGHSDRPSRSAVGYLVV